jgi:hypothetical protein
MELAVHFNDRLPRLAWLATVDQQDATVIVRCGQWVETGANFFVEGAWAGDFAAGALDQTECVFGSGAVIRSDSVVFVPSLATTDYLYYRHESGHVILSNSLPLLLASTGDELNPACDRYGAINRSILRGFKDQVAEIPTRQGSIQRLIHQNLRIDRGSLSLEPKREPPRFTSFSEYRAYLRAASGALLSNARSEARRRPLFIASTQSRGYDTTAINAITCEVGIDAVFTIATAKPTGSFSVEGSESSSDDGTEICGSLGLANIVRLDRSEFFTAADDERLLLATLDDNADANFIPICRRLPEHPSLLLTGTLGEIWYPERIYTEWREPNSGAHLARWDLGTHGLIELRLKYGFVQAPIVYLGARNRDDIFRLSDSAEMAPWHVEGRYNRPLPRRIAEEAGVPREAFGQRKMATVVEFPSPQIPWSAELRAGYYAFLRRNKLITPFGWSLLPLVHSWNTAAIFASPTKHRALYYAQRLLIRFGRRDTRLPQLGRALDGRLFCFAANTRVTDYVHALESSPAPSATGSAPKRISAAGT